MSNNILKAAGSQEIYYYWSYNVIITRNSVAFQIGYGTHYLNSDFRNYIDRFGVIRIKNIYFSLNAYAPHEREQMFKTLAFIFNIKLP